MAEEPSVSEVEIDSSLIRFEDEILAFEQKDADSLPPKNAALFVGSSSFRRWFSMQEDLAPHPVINRGFGGSTMRELNYYMDRIVMPYSPACIFLYEGDNDIVPDSVSPSEVLEEVKIFAEKILEKMPETAIYFVGVKPSPSRKHLLAKARETNSLMENYAEEQDNFFYVDVMTPMMETEEKVRGDIFIEDSLHLNESGYQIWTKIISPILEKEIGS